MNRMMIPATEAEGRQGPMDSRTITDIFTQPGVQTVSFDIFDTLIERPALYPDDIFCLLNQPVKELLHDSRFDFYQSRRRIEHEAVQHFARGGPPEYILSFEQIYDHFRSKHRLSADHTQQIMALERDLEKRLLAPRTIGRRLFDAARDAGKRIICITDMYHDASFLAALLEHNGFGGVHALYVSSLVKKRKDTGALFSHVLAAEKLAPHELVHIGDHIDSDYRIPLRLGIPAVHLPSSREHFFSSTKARGAVWNADYSPSERLVIGFYINRWSEAQGGNAPFFSGKRDAGYFGIGPVLFGIAQYLRTHRAIQDDYPRIHFASRDGYLPMAAYDYLNKDSCARCIPSAYLYCGRALYHAADYRGDPLAHLTRRLQRTWSGPGMTLGHLFDSLVSPTFLPADDPRRERLVSLELAERFPTLRAILAERRAEADRLLRDKKQKLHAYYADTVCFSSRRRALVFDCGYSGSVSAKIMQASGGRIDKAYLCETSKNRWADLIHRTRTHLLFGDLHDLHPAGSLILFEEVFSAPDGPCIDLSRAGDRWTPICDQSQPPSGQTAEDVRTLQQAAMDFVHDLKARFGPYLDQLTLSKATFTAEPLLAVLRSPDDTGIRHFGEIVFPDPYYGDSRPLSEKIEDADRNHLLRTPFVDRAAIISRPPPPETESALRIGLHLHLYHMDMASCFFERLAGWQAPYDLFISVCSPRDEQTARILFSPLLKRNAGKLVIRVLPNRGRDAGAWVAGFGADLAGYDLAGHVHSKQSQHFAWGDQWRDYLLDHVIGWDAFADIRAHFQRDPSLGLVFPPIYDGVYEFWGKNRLTHLEEVDRRNTQDLLRRMGIKEHLTTHNLHFSVGTMFWYRPAALAPLINLGLCFDDFEVEPVGITGSLAHAIERLPALVAEHGGFSSRAYIRQDALLDRYHQQRLRAVGAESPASLIAAFSKKAGFSFSQLLLPLLPPGTRRHRLAQAAAAKMRFLFSRS